MTATRNNLAKTFKALHKPGSPLIVANVYDAVSAQTVASLPEAKAIATASYAVAEAAGRRDEELTRAENFRAASIISSAVNVSGKPLSVDFRDGYGDDLEEGIRELIHANVVGVNLEDFDNETKKLYQPAEAADRVRRVLAEAKKLGVPDFVVNARCDVLVQGGKLEEVIERGKAYLAAGATAIFVWGAGRGVSRDEVAQLVEAFGGRLNVLLKLPDGLSTSELAKTGVSRISVGPTLQFKAMEGLKTAAEAILKQ